MGHQIGVDIFLSLYFQVMYRDGTYDLPGDGEGNGWTKVSHYLNK